jgi:membrane associated rhomboid family serine protease
VSSRQRFPIVTLLLIAANLLAEFVVLVNPDLGLQFGFHPDHPTFQTIFTSLFLHANVVHLLGNMIFLAAVGAAVEMAAGSVRFACVYFVSGVIGVLCQYLVTRHAGFPAPVLGASGCIAGCAGYYSVRYTGLRVPIAPKLSMNVATVTGIWIALQVVGAFIRIGDSAGVAFWSHLGGFAGGILISLVFRAPDLGQVRLGHEVLDRMNNRSPVAAATSARKHLERHPGDPKALHQLARSCAQMDDSAGEGKAILELLEVEPLAEHPVLLARLVEIGEAKMLSCHRRNALAEKFKDVNPGVARALLRSVLQDSTADSQRPEALLALVGLEREKEPKRAQALLDELLRSYPLHPCADLARKRGWVN